MRQMRPASARLTTSVRVSAEQCFGLRRADEIVHGKTTDIVRRKPHQTAAPSQLNIRVVIFTLGDPAQRVDERECADEILETILFADFGMAGAEFPTRQEGEKFARARSGKLILLALECRTFLCAQLVDSHH